MIIVDAVTRLQRQVECPMNSSTEQDDELLLKVAEVAELLRVSKMTVYRLIRSGEMGASRFGRSFRIPRSSVHQYRESHRIPNQRKKT